MNIYEFRKVYPQYESISDDDLSRRLHKRFYSEMPYEDFTGKFLDVPEPVDPNPETRPEGFYDDSKGFFNNLPEGGFKDWQKRGMAGDLVRTTIGKTTKEREQEKTGMFGRSYTNSISSALSDLEEQGLQDSPEYRALMAEFNMATSSDKAIDDQEFSISEMASGLANLATEDPGQLAAGVVTGFAEDPLLALTPLGYKKAVATAAAKGAGKGAQMLTGVAGASALGAGTMAPISALDQIDMMGRVNPAQVAMEAGVTGALTGAMGPIYQGMTGAMGPIYQGIGSIARRMKGKPRDKAPAPKTAQPAQNSEVLSADEAIRRTYGVGLNEQSVPDLPPYRPPQADATPVPDVGRTPYSRRLPAAQQIDESIERINAELEGARARTKELQKKNEQIEAAWSKREKVYMPDEATIRRDSLDASDPRYLGWIDRADDMKARIEATKDAPANNPMAGALKALKAPKLDDAKIKARIVKNNSAKQLDAMLRREGLSVRGNKSAKAARLMAKGKQGGAVSPELNKWLAAAGVGAFIGSLANTENPIEGAVSGSVLGLLTIGGVKAIQKASKNLGERMALPDKEIRISDRMDKWDADIATHQRETMQIREALRNEIPDINERNAISHYMEGSKDVKISEAGKQWAKKLRKVFDEIYRLAKENGVIESYLDDYVSHFWKLGKKPSDLFDALTDSAQSFGQSMSGKSRHAKSRTIPTLREGMEQGLKPVTEDIADIIKLYGDSVYRSIMNKQLADDLRQMTSPETGMKLIMPAGKAPADYKSIDSPYLVGSRVHPDIEPSLRFVYASNTPSELMRGVSALNFASKRMLVSTSFFHANALLESMIYAGINPLDWTKGKINKSKVIPGGLPSNPRRSIDMLMNGQTGDVVDTALRSGLKIGTIEDVGNDIFYQGLDSLGDAMGDSMLGKAAASIPKTFKAMNKVVDKVMWDTIMTGGKLTVFAKEYERALLKHPNVPKEVLAKEVAAYVNDAFGGQNWRMIAEDLNNRLARRLALAANAPNGRQWMQLILFAPDWTISNLRILGKALPSFNKSKRSRKMHQWYFARGALFALIGGSLVQSLIKGELSGLWENEDPTTVDLGDGRKMTWSKQFFEPYHWATDGFKTGLNKLGFATRTPLEQAMNKKWISPYGAPPIIEDPSAFPSAGYLKNDLPARAGHLANKFVPIGIQQGVQYGPQAALAGMFGHPIYRYEWDDD